MLRARDAVAVPTILLVGGESSEESVAAAHTARELVARLPQARVTLLVSGPTGDAEPLLERGVELAVPEPDEPGWLAARSFHYDVVAGSKQSLARRRAVLDTTQPQAVRAELDEDPIESLRAAGLPESV